MQGERGRGAEEEARGGGCRCIEHQQKEEKGSERRENTVSRAARLIASMIHQNQDFAPCNYLIVYACNSLKEIT